MLEALCELSSTTIRSVHMAKPGVCRCLPTPSPPPPRPCLVQQRDPTPGQQVPIFGIPRLLSVVIQNIRRIDFVWPLAVPHLLSAAATGTAEIRACAVDSYTKVSERLVGRAL